MVGVDLVDNSLLPPIPTALLQGRAESLLSPMNFVVPAAATGGVDAIAQGLEGRPDVDRSTLAKGLAANNAAYGHLAAATLGKALSHPETLVVVTGQQPGLFGGPLYTLTKAVAAQLWAEALERAGKPAVAVFWVATEDHDWRESSWSAFPSPEGTRRIDLGEDPSPLTPVGMRMLGEGVHRLLQELPQMLGTAGAGEWLERLGSFYVPGARFGEAFSRWMVSLLGERCPLLLDAMDPVVKEAQRPYLRRFVERRDAVSSTLNKAEKRVQEAGFNLQVAPQPGASPLFLLHGSERRRIEWAGEQWRVRDRGQDDSAARPLHELEEVLEDNPTIVSPGVLARPVIQDAILGTALQVMGPGEVSYLAQVAPLYDVLGVSPPAVSLRPQALVLEGRDVRKLEALPLTLDQLMAEEFDLDAELAGSEAEELLEPARATIDTALGQLAERTEALDPGLAVPLQKTRGSVERSLAQFEGKLRGALARRREVDHNRAVTLREKCRPMGQLQERVLSTSAFPLRHGERFVHELFQQLKLEPTTMHQVEL